MVVPTARRKRIRYILGEDAHGVLPRWSNTGIMHALEVKLAPELLRQTSRAGCGIAGFPFRLRQGSVDLTKVMRLLDSWPGSEVRQLTQQHVQLNRASFDGNRAHLLGPG